MNLTAIGGGITRLRTKGVPRRDTLYDLVNGFVTSDGTIEVRPGTVRHATLPAGTKGLTAHDGQLHVFAHEVPADPLPDGYVVHVISHPDAEPDDPDYELAEIHFAEAFMGFLYVAAEFANGDTYHFWLQTTGAWQANTVYDLGAVVEPTVATGIAYRALRMGAAYPSWAPNVPRAVGDRIEPTEYNGYYYEVVDTIGTAPASGTVEPDWVQIEGAQVIEDIEGVTGETAQATEPPAVLIPFNIERYER